MCVCVCVFVCVCVCAVCLLTEGALDTSNHVCLCVHAWLSEYVCVSGGYEPPPSALLFVDYHLMLHYLSITQLTPASSLLQWNYLLIRHMVYEEVETALCVCVLGGVGVSDIHQMHTVLYPKECKKERER